VRVFVGANANRHSDRRGDFMAVLRLFLVLIACSFGCAPVDTHTPAGGWAVQETYAVHEEGSCESERTIRMNALAAEVHAADDLTVLEELDVGEYENDHGEWVSYAKVKASSTVIPTTVEYGIQCTSSCEPGDDKSTCYPKGCQPQIPEGDAVPWCSALICKGYNSSHKCKGSCNSDIWAVSSDDGISSSGIK